MNRSGNAKKVVMVGASTGLGRCLSLGLARRGEAVAMLARREDLLKTAVAEAGESALAVRCDVTDEHGCREAIERAAGELGGIDALIYGAGVSELRPIEQLDSETWHRVFDTNVVGANTATAAALPYLAESNGTVLYLTTIAASMTSPWPGLASYHVTKAGLDRLVDAWRTEHPDVNFTRFVVGECAGGEGDASSHFMDPWNPAAIEEFYPVWLARGLITEKTMDVDDFVDAVSQLLHAGPSLAMPVVAMTPRRPI